MNMTHPSLADAICVHAEATKVLHEALDREYRNRRANLVNAGFSRATNSILPSIQEDVRGITSLTNFSDEQLKGIHAAFSVWTPPRDVTQVRLPVIN